MVPQKPVPSRGPSFLIRVLAWAFLALSLEAAAQTPGLDAPQAVGAHFNGVFPVTAPGQSTGWTTENAFPNLTFVDPLWLTEIPGSGQLLVVGKNGRIWRFANSPAVTQAQVVQVLDWSAKTQTSEDQGFYSLVFHPQFGQAGSPNAAYVYVCYSHKPALTGANANNTYWRVSRFTWLSGNTIDPNSEQVLINQYDPDLWHNGGAMFFDNQGFLNITCGDGGDSGAVGGIAGALANTQRIDSGFFSGLFRIDVDNDPAKSHPIRRQPSSHANKPASWPASSTQGYGIPDDNPWQDPAGGVLEEFAAIGLRSPHTAHYDTSTGDVWVGDVGEGAREELTRLTTGDNAQWGYQEGTLPGPGVRPALPLGVERVPVFDYGRSTGTCIIGGMRYRGAKWNITLGGKVLFGDHVRGRIWSATLSEGAAPVVEELVSGFHTGNKAGLANFCTDSAGEVYLMDLNGTNAAGGTIRKLVSQGVSTEPPALLSQTGVFTNLATLETAPGVIPYDVANPLWSDGAHKRRWLILPNDGSHDTAAERIAFSESGNWVFPAGAVFVKHFEMPVDERNPALVRRLETRFIICTPAGGKYGVTYKWNAAGTDAELLTTGDAIDLDLTDLAGVTRQQRWDFPSRADCLLCHNPNAGQALGLRTPQMNRGFTYPSTGRTANQLSTFNALGMFDRTLTVAELSNFLESRALEDDTAPLEHRVRSYLDSNCSHCHQPGGTIDYFDARLGTALNLQGFINGIIRGHFDLGPDGRYMKPGDPALSATHVRLSHAGDGVAMPPLAKNAVDPTAVAALHDYLLALDPAEFETTPLLQARYVRLTATSEVNNNPWTSVGEFTILDADGAAIPASELSVKAVDSEETVEENSPASRAIDGNSATFWHTGYGSGGEIPMPHFLTVDLGSLRPVGGYIHLPRQDGSQNGRIKNYQVHTSVDGNTWTLLDSGAWPNTIDPYRYDAGVSVRPARCQIAGPSGTVSGAFDVTVAFDMDVTDFSASDLHVSGGSVTGLRGKGYYYVARISPSSPFVSVSVPGGAVDPKGAGSLPSGTLELQFQDTLPPVPRFTSVPPAVNGTFQIGLTFDETVTGLQADDILVTNGLLGSISPAGSAYVLTITPSAAGSVGIAVREGAVSDLAGNAMGPGTSVSIPFLAHVLAREAEEGTLTGGFVSVSDPSASGGSYIWVPQDSRGGSYAFNAAIKAVYSFVVPRAGQYRVRGLVRSDDASSDSLYIGFDGQLPAADWHTNQIAGQVGSLQFTWDIANSSRNPLTNPLVFTLTEGAHTLEIYGRDDGTRLDRLELQPVRPLPQWTAPAIAVGTPFTLTLSFSESVAGLELSDFAITGGQVLGISGSGATYTIQVDAQAPTVLLMLPENAVTGISGNGNHASDPVAVVFRTHYQHWAIVRGVDDTPATRLLDEDGDGVPKLLEFAFNLNPAVADGRPFDPDASPLAGLPRALLDEEGGSPRLSLQFLRRKNATGLSYTPQFGSSPADLSAPGGAPVIESLGADWERVTVPDTADDAPRRFGRVRVTLDSP